MRPHFSIQFNNIRRFHVNITKLFSLFVVTFVFAACGGRIEPESPVEDSTIVPPAPTSTAPPAPTTPPPPVEDAALTASLSFEVASNVYVKKEQHAKLVAITFTSGSKPVTLKGLTLTGQAKIASTGCGFGMPCARESFAKRVTSVAMYDGATQVGYVKAPDPVTGKALIPNMDVAFPPRTSKTFVVQATLSSSASAMEPLDQIALGIESSSDPIVLDSSGKLVSGDAQLDIRNQLSAAPVVVQTIRPSGELSIVELDHPASQIVVAGKDAWIPVAQYKASAKYEAIDMDRVNLALVTWPGVKADPADVTAIAVASGGFVRGLNAMSSLGLTDVDLSGSSISVPKDGDVLFQIWAKFAPVVASSTVGGSWTGVCRSGHAPAFMLNSDLATGEWDSVYKGRVNARSTGGTSGERVYVDGWVRHGNPMVIRKSKPIVTLQKLSTTTLADVDQDLIKFQVAADSEGSVAVKQVMLYMVSKKSGLTLSNFRLRDGSADMDTAMYAITELWTGTDLTTSSVSPDGVTQFAVSFKPGYEEKISGSGHVYTIHATISGTTGGQSLIVEFRTTGVPSLVTGTLTNGGGFEGYKLSPLIFNIDRRDPPMPGSSLSDIFTGTFVWSDLSEVPHSAALGTTGGSHDWTNSYLVNDLTGSVTLTK